MQFWYSAVKPFGPENGEAWQKYVEWSKLYHLKNVISLDACLCEPIIKNLIDEDWHHNVHEDYFCDFFWDLNYLRKRIEGIRGNILAVVHNPEVEVADAARESGYIFYGYDLIEKRGGISALTNCGGFEGAFEQSDVNEQGLISIFDGAKRIQQKLTHFFPEEPHADCDLWAIALVPSDVADT